MVSLLSPFLVPPPLSPRCVGVRLDNKVCESLEAVLSRVHAKTLKLEKTNLEDEVWLCHLPASLSSLQASCPFVCFLLAGNDSGV